MLKSNKNEKPLVLGILGAGQLAKMIANEAYKLGINVATIDKSANTPAGDMTKLDFAKSWDDPEELSSFIEASDIVTLENEFISPEILEKIEKKVKVFPSSKTMKMIQDKYIQKNNFLKVGLPVPIFAEINSIDDAIIFAEKVNYPYVIKTRTLGYDGYGNMLIRNEEDIKLAFDKFQNRKLMAEEFVNFSKELAVMAVRSQSGEVAVFPCVETIQENHICHIVIAPAKIDPKVSKEAQEIAKKCVEAIDGVGVFGIELFLCSDNTLLINEIAPRPHNSGHYTIEACYTSQFENCIRAVLDLPLGSCELVKSNAVMVNLLGKREGSGVPLNVKELLKFDKAKLHLYNKKQSRNGRKMGHITVIGDDAKSTLEYALKAEKSLIW